MIVLTSFEFYLCIAAACWMDPIKSRGLAAPYVVEDDVVVEGVASCLAP
jgi:hypothetical protein